MRHNRSSHSRSKGFTLLELMIVVAIVAILTTIAYPNYRDYVIRGQLVDATQGLSALRANLERYFQDNRTYTATGPFNSLQRRTLYLGEVSQSPASPRPRPLSRRPWARAAPLSGFTFTVDQADNQATVVAPPAPTSFQSCTTAWVTKTGGC